MVIQVRLILALPLLLLSLAVACSSGGSEARPTATTQSAARTPAAPRGPTATLDPRNGPPGTELTITGAGWPSRATLTVVGGSAQAGAPYATVTTNDDGTFTTKFRLEKQPNGADLQIGRFDIVARSGAAEVVLPFQVDSRRPVQGPGPGGG